MPVTSYERFRFLWGAVDWQSGSNSPYATGQTQTLGVDATGGAGHIGVRRCLVTLDRTAYEASLDPAEMHFDFLNITSGSPDDTWTSGDYTTLEGLVDSAFTGWASYMSTKVKVTQYSWYRVGVGIVPPNPAERMTVKTTAIAGSGTAVNALQVASSLTFRTAWRKSWGRTYLPVGSLAIQPDGRLSSATTDNLCNVLNTMVVAAAAADFRLVVTSRKLSAALNVERVEVDNVPDIIRRRRHRASTYKKLLP